MKKYFTYSFMLLLLLGCDPQAGLKKWVIYRREVETKDPKYPLKVFKDGYRVVEIYTIDEIEMAEWSWQVSLKNVSKIFPPNMH